MAIVLLSYLKYVCFGKVLDNNVPLNLARCQHQLKEKHDRMFLIIRLTQFKHFNSI